MLRTNARKERKYVEIRVLINTRSVPNLDCRSGFWTLEPRFLLPVPGSRLPIPDPEPRQSD